jgi:ubiquinone/menaquinone biosynthesis C-methylase UbiE
LSNLFKVGIGTGDPIAFTLAEKYKICGIDISPLLIEKCLTKHPNISCKVGDIDYPEGSFDLVYCIHSTFFPNYLKSITEMLRIVKKRGCVCLIL